MATLKSQLQPLQITPGVQPVTDRTPLSTPHFTFTDKIRFWRGIAQKIGGWMRLAFSYGASISGIARTLYSAVINNIVTTVIATSMDLYALYGQILTNITPLVTVSTPIPNSIETDFGTLGANPISVVSGSPIVTVTDSHYSKYQANDSYTLSGATTTGGILNTALNAAHIITSIGIGTVSFMVGSNASSTTTGGGASVVRSTGLLTFTVAAHGQNNGDRTKITGAAASGGVTALQTNLEFIVRNVTVNTFDVMTAGTAISHVTAAGGAGAAYYVEITSPNAVIGLGLGYGLGLYGTGLYGVVKFSTGGIVYPSIWSMDRFADRIIMNPGNQSPIYVWDGDISVAPTQLSGAPTAINYIFVSDNILVTFGYQDVPNQIFSSDQGDPTEWVASSENQVFQDTVEGAGQLISSVPVLGVNLIFTPNQTYRFSYIGQPLIWEIKLLDNSIGIIGQNARCSVNNVAYWMSHNNFYRWSGANVEIIPANTQDQCTALNYVFGNINTAQISKCFAWFNALYNEVWFHYPDVNSEECNRIARVSIIDNIWSVDTMDRTCAEYPANLLYNPRLISSTGNFYMHEIGNDDDNVPLEFTLKSNLRSSGKNSGIISGFIPDNIQTGTIDTQIQSYQFPRSTTTMFDNTYLVTESMERSDVQIGGNYWQYTWTGDDLDQEFVMGQWQEYIQQSSPN